MASGRALASGMKPGRVVVDTSVVSYLLKGHTLAAWYSDLLRGRLVGLFFMSLGELYLPVGHPQPTALPRTLAGSKS